MHPTVVILARGGQVELSRGTVVGARSRVILGDAARVHFGRDVWLASDVELQTDGAIRIGAGSTIQRRCTINGTTRLGRGCIFAPNVFVSSRGHTFRALPHLPIREQERRVALDSTLSSADPDRPVSIEDDCWLGANVVVAPGVTIGKGSVVGANSVVLKNVEPYSVVAGAPARLISRRLDWKPRSRLELDREEDHVYVLSGAPIRCESGRIAGFAPGIDEPLLIAIAADRQATVYYEASRAMTLLVMGQALTIRPGEGRFAAPLAAASRRGDALILTIVLPANAPVQGFKVLRVESDDQ